MTKKTKLLLFSLIMLGVLFVIYQSITKTERHPAFLTQAVDSNSIESQDASKSGYVFSHPSNGALAKTYNISITHHEDNTATGTIDNTLFTPRMGQDVILYSVANDVMPFPGKILNIQKRDQHSTITIDIPKEIKQALKIDTLSNNADIIIFSTISSQRYPYSALQKDKNGNHFVWTVEKTEDKTSNTHIINKTWIDKPILGLKFFIAGAPINAFSLVVLNPDNMIKDGKSYKSSNTIFDAPIYAGHKQALKDYKQKLRNIKKRKIQEAIEDCQNKNTSDDRPPIPGSNNNASCSNDNSEKTTDDIIRSLLSR